MRSIRLGLSALALMLLTACASGPVYKDFKASIPVLAEDKGRVFFYRPEKFMGGGIRPKVVVNGNVVGPSTPGGFFFVDLPPGSYEVVTTTEVERKLSFQLAARDVRCVRLSVSLGVLVYRIYPELADKARCDSEIEDLNLMSDEK
jgi:hypothetical protein